eukprot:17005-Eustigmatos_ZCMA.PRE.1
MGTEGKDNNREAQRQPPLQLSSCRELLDMQPIAACTKTSQPQSQANPNNEERITETHSAV